MVFKLKLVKFSVIFTFWYKDNENKEFWTIKTEIKGNFSFLYKNSQNVNKRNTFEKKDQDIWKPENEKMNCTNLWRNVGIRVCIDTS